MNRGKTGRCGWWRAGAERSSSVIAKTRGKRRKCPERGTDWGKAGAEANDILVRADARRGKRGWRRPAKRAFAPLWQARRAARCCPSLLTKKRRRLPQPSGRAQHIRTTCSPRAPAAAAAAPSPSGGLSRPQGRPRTPRMGWSPPLREAAWPRARGWKVGEVRLSFPSDPPLGVRAPPRKSTAPSLPSRPAQWKNILELVRPPITATGASWRQCECPCVRASKHWWRPSPQALA